MNSPKHHVVFIDGICVLCNRLSRLLIRLDAKKQFLFSTHNSAYAKQTLVQPKEDSILMFSQKGIIYCKSKAIPIYHSPASVCQMDWHIVSNYSDFYLRPFV